MSKLLENTELYNYLKDNHSKIYYRFEKIFKKNLSYKKFGTKELNDITELDLRGISSTSGIDDLKNLKSLSLTDIPNLTDVDKLENLKQLQYISNKDDVNISQLIYLSQNSNLDSMQINGKCVKDISPLEALELGENTSLSYQLTSITLTPSQFSLAQEKIQKLSALITPDMTEIEKVKTIYTNMLSKDFKFDFDNYNPAQGLNRHEKRIINNTMYGPLIKNRGVCSGIACALEAVFTNIGLESKSCGGWLDTKPSAGNYHEWNQVKVDGHWYNLDLTNDYDLESWRYFMKSDNDPDWAKFHYADPGEKHHPCTSTKYDDVYRENSVIKQKRIQQEMQYKLDQEKLTSSSHSNPIQTINRFDSEDER